MRVLVTGGAGFIGSALARRLVGEGHSVAIVDNLSTGRLENLPKEAEFVALDVAAPDFLGKLPKGRFDAVCHLAAQTSSAGSDEDPLYDLRANAGSTLLLSRWCVEKQVPRLIFAGSMASYGDISPLPAAEGAVCLPKSYYGASKLASENILRVAAQEGLHSTSLRMFSVYGAGQNLAHLKQGMLSIYLAYVLKGVEIPVTGSLDRFRDFVHADDVVEAWMLALSRPSTPSFAYNVGCGKPTLVREALQKLFAACGERPDYPVRELKAAASDQFGCYADVSLIERELGWKPRVSLDQGLASMAAWAKGQGVKS